MKLGFACKYLDADAKQPYPFKATTRTRFLSLDNDARAALIHTLAAANLANLYLTFEELARLPPALRMMRIGSDLLPLYTVPEATVLYHEFLPTLYPLFTRCGEFARANDIRLSFHPGQYSVLASDNPQVVERALEDVEYHTLCATLMGYGQRFQDFKINIHMMRNDLLHQVTHGCGAVITRGALSGGGRYSSSLGERECVHPARRPTH